MFIGMQRALLPSQVMLEYSLRSGHMVFIPTRFNAEGWTMFVGVVKQIRLFTDGTLALFDTRFSGSLLENWETAPVWIPKSGMCGVLAIWK